jgi:hypothetical protein
VSQVIFMDTDQLTTTAASALVTVMVTQAWNGIKTMTARFLARDKPESEALAELETTRELVLADPDARSSVQKLWQRRLASLLEAYPEAATDLQTLLQEISQSNVEVQPVSGIQNSGSAGGSIYQVQGSSQVTIRPETPKGLQSRWR